MTTESTNEPKQKQKMRPNSRMTLLVDAFKAGTTKIEDLAVLLKEAEENGKITGLKKKDDEFKAKKDLAFYKKVVNWYLNQAKHKGHIDAPISVRRMKSKKETVAEVMAAAQAHAESTPVDAPVSSEEIGIPTI